MGKPSSQQRNKAQAPSPTTLPTSEVQDLPPRLEEEEETSNHREEINETNAAASSSQPQAPSKTPTTTDIAPSSRRRQPDDGEAPVVRPDEFVNQGLLHWEEMRSQWLAVASDTESGDLTPLKAAVPLDVDEVIDFIFSTRWRSKEQFEQPVPLPQMVDVLVDLWEAEGLDV